MRAARVIACGAVTDDFDAAIHRPESGRVAGFQGGSALRRTIEVIASPAAQTTPVIVAVGAGVVVRRPVRPRETPGESGVHQHFEGGIDRRQRHPGNPAPRDPVERLGGRVIGALEQRRVDGPSLPRRPLPPRTQDMFERLDGGGSLPGLSPGFHPERSLDDGPDGINSNNDYVYNRCLLNE